MTAQWLMTLQNFKSPNVFNPWSECDPLDVDEFGYMDRIDRLKQHLAVEPVLILIGEAPGYQGYHFSGVPFTNEKLILGGHIPRVTPRISVSGRLTTRRLPFCEPSATIVWGGLHNLGLADRVILWNAFAFHPYKPGNTMSNRAPKPSELIAAAPILHGLLAIHTGVPVLPVGKVAERTLANLGIDASPSIRHPSMGGAKEFFRGLSDAQRAISA